MSAAGDHVPPESLPARPVRIDAWQGKLRPTLTYDSRQEAYAAECGVWLGHRMKDREHRESEISPIHARLVLAYLMTTMPAEFLSIARTFEELVQYGDAPPWGDDLLAAVKRAMCKAILGGDDQKFPREIDEMDLRSMAVAAVKTVLAQEVQAVPLPERRR